MGCGLGPCPLRTRHPAKLRGPEHKRVFQQAPLLEILDEGRRSPRHAGGERPVIPLDILVAVPVAARKPVVVPAPHLDESHPPL